MREKNVVVTGEIIYASVLQKRVIKHQPKCVCDSAWHVISRGGAQGKLWPSSEFSKPFRGSMLQVEGRIANETSRVSAQLPAAFWEMCPRSSLSLSMKLCSKTRLERLGGGNRV